jgi:hypothetical protein
MSEIVVDLPTKLDFASAVDSDFRARAAEGATLDLRLIRLDEIISTSVQENFSLLFQAPNETPPVQTIYRLEHAKLGEMDVFLVPVKQDADGLYFEAVFNQLL